MTSIASTNDPKKNSVSSLISSQLDIIYGMSTADPIKHTRPIPWMNELLLFRSSATAKKSWIIHLPPAMDRESKSCSCEMYKGQPNTNIVVSTSEIAK